MTELRFTRTFIVSKLLRAMYRGGEPTLSPVSVTITDNGTQTSSLMGVTYGQGKNLGDPTSFRQLGGGFSASTGVVTPKFNSSGVEFYTDADEFEVWIRAGAWDMFIDGQYVAGNPQISAGDGFKRVSMGSAAVRKIELRFTAAVQGTGVVVRNVFSVWPAPLREQPLVPIVGDSYDVSVGFNGVIGPSDGFAMKTGRYNGWNTIPMGSGGTGYTAGGNGTFASRTTPGGQFNSLVGFEKADMVLVCGSFNDSTTDATTLQNAVVQTINNIRAQCTTAIIIGIGAWRASQNSLPAPLQAALVAGWASVAATDNRVGFIDPIAANWQYGYDNHGPNGGLGGSPQQRSGEIAFTSALSAATSGTLTTPWGGATGSLYTIVFGDGTLRTNCTLTNGSTAASWSTAVTSVATGLYAYQPIVGIAGSGNTGLYDDGAHPDLPGHRYLAYRVGPAVGDFLASLLV
jgi:hypothetical protein